MNPLTLSLFLALAVVSVSGQRRNQNKEVVVVGGQKVVVNKDLTLSDIKKGQLTAFMKNPAAVRMLVVCFDPQLRRQGKCTKQSARSLVNDVRKLGTGGVCGGAQCTNRQEKSKVEGLVKKAISLMQKHHPQQWRKVIPNIQFLL